MKAGQLDKQMLLASVCVCLTAMALVCSVCTVVRIRISEPRCKVSDFFSEKREKTCKDQDQDQDQKDSFVIVLFLRPLHDFVCACQISDDFDRPFVRYLRKCYDRSYYEWAYFLCVMRERDVLNRY